MGSGSSISRVVIVSRNSLFMPNTLVAIGKMKMDRTIHTTVIERILVALLPLVFDTNPFPSKKTVMMIMATSAPLEVDNNTPRNIGGISHKVYLFDILEVR